MYPTNALEAPVRITLVTRSRRISASHAFNESATTTTIITNKQTKEEEEEEKEKEATHDKLLQGLAGGAVARVRAEEQLGNSKPIRAHIQRL